MTKYILAGGFIYKALDGGKAFVEELVKDITDKPVKVLDCLFAQPKEVWQEKFEGDKEYFSKFISDFELELADEEKFVQQVQNSDVIYLRGGHTQQLFKLLTKNIDWINYLDGKTLAGTSAGGEVIAQHYHVLKSGRTGDGLGLLQIKFIPHWKSDFSDEYTDKVIDWDKTIEELKNYKEDLEILTLKEGEFKVLYR